MLYMHVCVFAHVHTHPTGTEGIIFTSEMHNFVLQSSLPPPPPPPKMVYTKGGSSQHLVPGWTLMMLHFWCVLLHLGPTLNLVRFVPKPAIVKDLWEESSGAEGGRGKQEKWQRPTFLPRLLWPSGASLCAKGHQVPGSPRHCVSPWRTPQPHTKHLLMLNIVWSCIGAGGTTQPLTGPSVPIFYAPKYLLRAGEKSKNGACSMNEQKVLTGLGPAGAVWRGEVSAAHPKHQHCRQVSAGARGSLCPES